MNRLTTPVLWTPFPFLSHTNLVISISIPVCCRTSYLYKRKPHRESSSDPITIPGYFIFQLQGKSPQALPIVISPLSRLSLSPQPIPTGLPPTSICSSRMSVSVRLPVQGELCFYLAWPLTRFGHGGPSLCLETLCSLGFCDLLTLPTSLVGLLHLFYSLFFFVQPLNCWAP